MGTSPTFSNGASSGKGNGGDATFGGQKPTGSGAHNPMVKWGVAIGALGLGGISSAWGSRVNQSLDIYPGAQQVGAYTGQNGNAAINATMRALQNPAILSGSTGGADAMGAANIVAQSFRSGVNPGMAGNTALGYSSVMSRVFGTDLTGGATAYTALRNPQVSWALRAHGLSNFVGPGMSQVNPIRQSMGILQQIGFNPYAPGALDRLKRDSQQGGMISASLLGATGGNQEAAEAIIRSATAQLTFQANGGKTVLGANSSAADWRKAGLGSTPVDAMRKAGIGITQQQMDFAQSQSGNIATTLAVQVAMAKDINQIAKNTAALGKFSPLFSGVTKLVELLAAGRIAAGAGGLGGLFGGGATTAAEGAGLGVGSVGVGGLATGAAAAAGAAAFNVGVGALGQKARGSSNPLIKAWGIGEKILPFLNHGIGDPPTNNISDSAFVQQHNRTGHGDSVTGLQGNLLHDVAAMMRANPSLVLNSGYRSMAEQQKLWNASDKSGRMVAKPGSSMHEKGLAVDLGPPSQYGWLRANAGKFGLTNYAPEPWHWELKGASSAGNRTDYGISGTAPTSSGGASVTGSFVSNMVKSNSSAAGAYISSQSGLFSSILGNATEMGSLGYRYSGGATSGAIVSGVGGSGGGGGGSIGPLPTGGDKRVPGHSITQWAHDVLTSMGISATPSAMDFMIKWANRESGGYNPGHAGGLYNPLNTTEGHFGYARNGGSQGNIKDYANYSQGVQNQAWNLTHTKGAGYDKILAALRGPSESAMASAVYGSSFGTKSGIGDPPSGGSGGGNIALHSQTVPIQANFNFTGGTDMTRANAKQFAEWSFEHLQRLSIDASNRRT